MVIIFQSIFFNRALFENMQVFDPCFTVENQASMLQPGVTVMLNHGEVHTVDQLVQAVFDVPIFY